MRPERSRRERRPERRSRRERRPERSKGKGAGERGDQRGDQRGDDQDQWWSSWDPWRQRGPEFKSTSGAEHWAGGAGAAKPPQFGSKTVHFAVDVEGVRTLPTADRARPALRPNCADLR